MLVSLYRQAGCKKGMDFVMSDRHRVTFGKNQQGAAHAALLALLFLVLLPLAAALPSLRIDQIEDASTLLVFLGRASGILGLSFLLLGALISIRVPGFDLWFGGLTRLWKIHHILGAASFLLLMAHPLLLAFGSAHVSVQAAAAVLFPESNAWSVWTGWLALAAMAVFLAPTFWFFGQPNYQRWKALHSLSGLALVLGVAHALPLSRSLPGVSGKAIWIGYGGLALLAFIYRLFLARRIGRKRYTVTRAENVARGIIEITLKPEERLLDYTPGQFIYFTPLDSRLTAGRNEEHPYTLSSAPREAVLRIVVKDVGDATHALQQITLGSQALVEGPYGEFFPAKKKTTRELWIAGGVGLAPFLGRARALTSNELVDIDLIYCVQDETRAHFLAELEGIAANVAGFRVRMHYFYREGLLTMSFITACCPDFAAREIYLCGPSPLIMAVRRELHRQHVPASHIHSEDFTWL
jgi:predicted ferric reductase